MGDAIVYSPYSIVAAVGYPFVVELFEELVAANPRNDLFLELLPSEDGSSIDDAANLQLETALDKPH